MEAKVKMDSGGFEYLLADIARMCRDRFERHGGTLGLTQTEFKALCTISCHEGIQQGRLATRIKVKPTTLAGLVDRMVHERWVERRPARADRLFVGEKIKPVVTAALQNAERTRHEALAGLDDGACEGMRSMLRGVFTNLSSNTEPLAGFDDGGRTQLRVVLKTIQANLRALETGNGPVNQISATYT
jgi:MarR family transcriptional regulator, transcriptional regulator for hemolysin